MIFSKSIERKIIKGTDIILIKLIMAVSDIDRATSQSANLVSIFDVTPPGAAAIIITPKASSIGVFNNLIRVNPIIGRTSIWQTKPTKKSFGNLITLVKSLKVRLIPSPSIIKAKPSGAIFVAISM